MHEMRPIAIDDPDVCQSVTRAIVRRVFAGWRHTMRPLLHYSSHLSRTVVLQYSSSKQYTHIRMHYYIHLYSQLLVAQLCLNKQTYISTHTMNKIHTKIVNENKHSLQTLKYCHCQHQQEISENVLESEPTEGKPGQMSTLV